MKKLMMKKLMMKKLHVITVLLMSVGVVMGQQESIKATGNNYCDNMDFEWYLGGYLANKTQLYGNYLGSSPASPGNISCTTSTGISGQTMWNLNYCLGIPTLPGNGILAFDPNRISRETIGLDPLVGIKRVPIYGGDASCKIGNSSVGSEADGIMVSLQPNSNMTLFNFWYAAVLEYCSNNSTSPIDQSGFRVFVYEIFPNSPRVDISSLVVNLGNGSSTLRASSSSSFLTKYNNTNIYFRDWTCAQIDLSNYVGKDILVSFVTNDCKHGGHFGYAYIDQICGICNTSYSLSKGTLNSCGIGTFDVNYSLPTVPSTFYYSPYVDLSLYAMQKINGISSKHLISSTSKSSGSSHTFIIDPNSISGLVKFGILNFDLYVEAKYYINSVLVGQKVLGDPITGLNSNLNDDYWIYCYNNYNSNINNQQICGPNEIKVDYIIPVGGSINGSVQLTLKATQNGGSNSQILNLLTITKTTGLFHNFRLNPETINLDKSILGFDYWVEAIYKHQGVVIKTENIGIPMGVSNPYKGRDLIMNNDYLFLCPKRPEACTTK